MRKPANIAEEIVLVLVVEYDFEMPRLFSGNANGDRLDIRISFEVISSVN